MIFQFDQLFERMPNGAFRERDKPAPLDPCCNIYVRHSGTGKIRALRVVPLCAEVRELDPNAKSEPFDWFANSPIYGGAWDCLPKTNQEAADLLGWRSNWAPTKTTGARSGMILA